MRIRRRDPYVQAHDVAYCVSDEPPLIRRLLAYSNQIKTFQASSPTTSLASVRSQLHKGSNSTDHHHRNTHYCHTPTQETQHQRSPDQTYTCSSRIRRRRNSESRHRSPGPVLPPCCLRSRSNGSSRDSMYRRCRSRLGRCMVAGRWM